MEVLVNGVGALPAESFDFEPTFDSLVEFLGGPAMGIQLRKDLNGIGERCEQEDILLRRHGHTNDPDTNGLEGKSKLFIPVSRMTTGRQDDDSLGFPGIAKRLCGDVLASRYAATEGLLSGLEEMHIPRGNVSTVEEDQIVGTEPFKMAQRHGAFSRGIGCHDGVEDDVVEDIKGTRDASHGDRGADVAGGLAKRFPVGFGVGQAARAAVERDQAKPPPSLDLGVLVEPLDRPMQEFDKHLMTELLSGLAGRTLGHTSNGNVTRFDHFEKAIQLRLQRRPELVHQEDNHGGEGKFAVASEIGRRKSVASEKLFRKSNSFQKSNEFGTKFQHPSCQTDPHSHKNPSFLLRIKHVATNTYDTNIIPNHTVYVHNFPSYAKQKWTQQHQLLT